MSNARMWWINAHTLMACVVWSDKASSDGKVPVREVLPGEIVITKEKLYKALQIARFNYPSYLSEQDALLWKELKRQVEE